MPTARAEGQRIRLGTYTSSGITSGYAITAFTVQNDQKQNGVTVVPWTAPFRALPPQYERIVIAADGTAVGDGFLSGVLPFDMWTFGMIGYVNTTFGYTSTVLSALVSMMLYDDTDTAIYLNATLYKPVRNAQFQDYDPFPGGWENVRWRYGFGVITA